MTLRFSGMRAGLDSPTRRFPAGYLELPQPGGAVPWPPEPYLPPRNTWLARRTPDADPLLYRQWLDLAFGGGKFVAVGAAAVVWSTDGIEWNSVELPYPLNTAVWRVIAYGGGLWVAMAPWTGDADIPQIMTASNPAGPWTAREAPINRQWTGAAYGGGVWVACAEGELFPGNGIGCMSIISTEGTSWEAPWLFGPEFPTLHHGLRGNLAAADDCQWTSIAYGWDRFAGAEPGEGANVWVAVMRDVTQYKRQARTAAWTTDPTDPSAPWQLIPGPSAGADKVIWSGTPDGEPEYDPNPLNEWPMASVFVSVRRGPSEIHDPAYHSGFKTIKNIHRSDNVFGINQSTVTWGTSPQVPHATFGWSSIARGPGGPNGSGTLVTISDHGPDNAVDKPRTVLRVVDTGYPGTDSAPGTGDEDGSSGFPGLGWHWYAAFSWEGLGFPLLAYGNDRFVALNNSGTQHQPSFVSLDGGKTWVSNVIAGSTDWSTIAFGGPYYSPKNDQRVWVMLSARNAPDPACWSKDAENWNRIEVTWSDEMDISWRKVRWFDHISKFVAVGTVNRGIDGVGSSLMTSSTGKTWTTPQAMWNLSGVGPRFRDIAYGGGRWVVVGDGGVARIAYSSNLSTWTRPDGDFEITQFASWKAVCFGGPAGFVAVGYFSRIATSPDGVNDWAFMETDFTVEGGTTDLRIDFEDVIWVELDPEDGTSYYSAIGHGDVGTWHCARSEDGVTWEPVQMGSGSKTWMAHVYTPQSTWAVAQAAPGVSGAYLVGAERDLGWDLVSVRQQPQPPVGNANWIDIAYGRNRYAACARATVFGGFNQQVATLDPNYVRPPLQFENVDIVGADEWRHTIVGADDNEAGLVAALSDTSDSSYLGYDWADPGEFGDVLPALTGVRFADLVNPDDLDIEGFWVLARMSRTPGTTQACWQVNVDGLDDARFEGGSANLGVSTSPSDYQYLTYTRVGAQYWTPAEFADARFTLFLTGTPPATFQLRRLRLRAIYAAPHVETVPVGEITARTGTVVGRPNTSAGLVHALSDGYDSTYLAGIATPTAVVSATVGFAALLNPTSKPIKSFKVEVRAVVWSGTGGTLTVDTFTGLTPDPLGHSGPIPLTEGVTVTYTAGPFTKPGGGTWTESQINAITCVIAATANSGAPAEIRLAAASLTVTYARGS